MFFFQFKSEDFIRKLRLQNDNRGIRNSPKEENKKNTKPLEEAESLLGNDNLYQMSTKNRKMRDITKSMGTPAS